MSKEKEARRKAAGPSMDPAAISYGMSPLPGSPPGPGNMNGNPMNFTSFGPQAASMNEGGMQENIYRDGAFNYPQTGADVLNPLNIPRSQIQQNTPMAGRGQNKGIPYGMQMQPPASQADIMESGRLGGEAQMKGLFPSAMGMTGMPATPGAIDPQMGGSMTGGSLPLSPANSMNPMTPGADKQVIKKKGKK